MGCCVYSTPQADDPQKVRRKVTQPAPEVAGGDPLATDSSVSEDFCAQDGPVEDRLSAEGDHGNLRHLIAADAHSMPESKDCAATRNGNLACARNPSSVASSAPLQPHQPTFTASSSSRSRFPQESECLSSLAVASVTSSLGSELSSPTVAIGPVIPVGEKEDFTHGRTNTRTALVNNMPLRAAADACPHPEVPCCFLNDAPTFPAVEDIHPSDKRDRADKKTCADDSRERGRPVETALAALGHEADEASLSADEETDEESPRSKFPRDVNVSINTRKLLLTWTKWGRNSLRISEEVHFKAMQHIQHPKARRFQSPSPISPQPTPPATPRGDSSACSGLLSLSTGSVQSSSPPCMPMRVTGRGLAGSKRVEMGLGAVQLTAHRGPPGHGEETSAAPFFDELLREQRQSMDAQGVKVKLCRKFGADAAKAKSLGTPGFGLETPSFVGEPSQGSADASHTASVMSSGIASPCAGGQLSPWILEAEALVNQGDDDDDDDLLAGLAALGFSGFDGRPSSKLVAAWGEPLSAPVDDKSRFCDSEGASGVTDGSGKLISGSEPRLETITDCDELDCVALFDVVDASAANQRSNSCSSPVGVMCSSIGSYATAGSSHECQPQSVRVRKEACAHDQEDARTLYKVGENVRYWSTTRSAWMLAVVIEQKSRGVYLIDKQMKGCVSKVHSHELISETEEQSSSVLRAIRALGCEHPRSSGSVAKRGPFHPTQPAMSKVDQFKSKRGLSTTVSSPTAVGVVSRCASRECGKTTMPLLRSRSHRADFSSDEEDVSPLGLNVTTRSTAASTVGSPAFHPDSKTCVSTSLSHAKGRVVRDDFSSDEEDAFGLDGTTRSTTASTVGSHAPNSFNKTFGPTPLHVRGRVVRDDFSSDEEDALPLGLNGTSRSTTASAGGSHVPHSRNKAFHSTSPSHAKGRVVRNDFSDDEDSDE
eukprot:TRINITY_DN38471_c0_g2_i1.p1 TRINITY_DN38471_c0_g2~~TRINITY_DN38471_c0_g2_i1.p1  ORF type:complete len:939 (-),score=126.60 TRINITY_DN38471_c0_g2_i1:173-2989(-)